MLLSNGRSVEATRIQLKQADKSLTDSLVEDDFEADDMQLETEPMDETPSRFQKLSTADVDAIQNSAKSKKTHLQTKWGVKIFRGW